MNIILRQAIKDDLNGLHEVMKVICDDGLSFETAGATIEDMGKDEKQYLMVAEDTDTGEILGSLYGMIFGDICGDGRPILLVENVAVLDKCQGAGVGKKMFAAIEEWGKSFSCHYVMLVSGNDREGAHHFYHRLGYSEEKGFKKYL